MSTKTNLIKTVLMLLSFTTIIMLHGCGPPEDKKIDTINYTVGGTVSGLSGTGTLVIQNNLGDDHTVSANGAFTFPTALADSSSYSVTVKTQPTGQTCTVTNGTGTISGGNVTNVAVACAASASAIDFSGTTSPGDNTIYMAKNSSLSSGDIIAIDAMVKNVNGVFGAAFDVDFDSTKITYDSHVSGSFLEQGGATVNYLAVLQSNNSNKLVVGISRQTGTATGSGTLITLKFKAVANGTANLSFSNNGLTDSANLSLSGISWSGGTVTVQ